MPGAKASNSFECSNDSSESSEGQTLSNNGLNEENNDATKESQSTGPNQSENNGQGQQGMPHASPSASLKLDEGLTQTPEHLFNACASHPYQDPYYGAMMAAYAQHQQMGYAPFIGMPHSRMALPLEMAQEPVYVNAKQYQGILRRRQARAKAELEKKLIKVRKPYLHESRHQHAIKRARGLGGRFAKKTEGGTVSGPSSQSISSSGSEPLPSSDSSAEAWSSPNMQQDARVLSNKLHETFKPHNYANGSDSYHNHNGSQSCSTDHWHLGDRAEDGDCSGQQRGGITTEHMSQRRLAIQ